MEKRYAFEHDLEVGDTLEIAGESYRIAGIGVTSDYDGPFKETSDTASNSKLFGPVFLQDEAYEAFKDSGNSRESEVLRYAYKLGNGNSDEELKSCLKERKVSGMTNLTEFLKREDNPRIFAAKNDKAVDIVVGIFAGVLVLILFAYVISVFVVHSIEKESSIIGTLYSMGVSPDYYNVLFSDEEIEIDPEMLYSTTTREDIVRGTSVFKELMMPMICTLTFASAVIFCVVMYLMMKVMIDRSGQNISIIKVFGYRKNEIRKLYLDGNFYVIALGALIALPLSKLIMNQLFPFMISNVACGLNLNTPVLFFVVIYIGVLALYFLINTLLVKRLDRFMPAEILKNRE